jgi:2,5-dihydroxypyridine 5,6-dioxygenase
MATETEMVALFKQELELCQVERGQTVAVLSEGRIRADYAGAFLIAAQALGANCFQINLPERVRSGPLVQVGRTPLAGNMVAIEALKRADLVIDLVGLLFSAEQNEITAAGPRMLFVHEPFDVLRALFPNRDLRRRVEFGERLLREARELRVTSVHGTDLVYRLGQYPVMTEYGFTDTPGRWDHFPSGFLLTQGNDAEVDGTLVLMPGDILNEFRRYVQQPVHLTIRRAMVTSIEGDGMEAQLLRHYIESFDDPRAYACSHIGWGLNERATWHHLAMTREPQAEIGVHGLAFYGNVLFSTGPNTELGGTNDTACHLDIPMRHCSLFLDDRPVVRDGAVVPLEMQAGGEL